jgi:hypothetical protein
MFTGTDGKPDGARRRVVALVTGTEYETVELDLTSIGARIYSRNAGYWKEIGTWGNDR